MNYQKWLFPSSTVTYLLSSENSVAVTSSEQVPKLLSSESSMGFHSNKLRGCLLEQVLEIPKF